MPILKHTDKGWSWVIMVSSFANHLNQGFFVNGIGILQVALLEKYTGAVAEVSWATGLIVGSHLMLGPVAGAVINRWSCRAALIIGSILMAAGLIISAFVSDLIYVIISMGIISGLGAGIGTTASEVVIGFNFVRYRNLACGFAVSGTGIGTLVFTPLMQMAKDNYGFTGLFIISGGICFQQVVFGALCRPSYLERKSKVNREEGSSRTALSDLLQSLRLLKRLSFVSLCLSMFAATFGIFTMNVHFTSLVIDQGTSESEAAFFLSIAGACNAFSRLLIGIASNADNINELLLYSGCFSVVGGTAIAIPLFIHNYTGQIVFAVILGTYSGCCFTLLNSITVKLVGIENLAMAYGLETFAGGFGGVVGPVILGILVDSGLTYAQSFMVTGVCVLMGGILGLSVSCFDKGSASRVDGSEVSKQKVSLENDKEYEISKIESKDEITYGCSDSWYKLKSAVDWGHSTVGEGFDKVMKGPVMKFRPEVNLYAILKNAMIQAQKHEEMPILNRTDKGWSWVVMISAFANHLNQGFFVTGIGVLQVALLEKYPGAVAKASWATGLLVGCHLMLGPVGGVVINRWSCRAALMIGSFLMTVGLVISAFVNDLIYVIILMGVVSGVGAGLSTTASEVVIGFNFVRYRNFACGVAVSGTGIGTLIFTSLMQMAKDEYGYTGFLLICGGICFQQVAFGALCRPSYLERKSKDDREKDESRTVLSDFLQSLSLLRRPSFFCLCSSMFAAIFGVFTMNVHFTSLVIDQGTSESEAAFFLSIAGACNAFSRLLIGTAANADNINELLLYSGCFSVLGGTATALPLFIEYRRGQIAFAVILGTYSGCCFSLLNSITVKLVGIENLAMAYGLEYFAGGFGGVVGPVILGVLVDSGLTYAQSFMVIGVCVLMGGILGWSVSCFDKGSASKVDGSGFSISLESDNVIKSDEIQHEDDITHAVSTDNLITHM